MLDGDDKLKAAKRILRKTSWFSQASDAFLQALASKLEGPLEVDEGHIFVREGDKITFWAILEEGSLVRTKISADGAEDFQKKKQGSARNLFEDTDSASYQVIASEMAKNSVVVDTVSGHGRVIGLLHNLKADEAVAYSTVTAHGSDPCTKVWLMSGVDFRSVIESDMAFAWEFIYAMSREVKTGSKSLQALIHKVKSTGQLADADEDAKNGTSTLKVLCYDTTSWVSENFSPAIKKFNESQNELRIIMEFTPERLSRQSATYAAGYDAVCTFVNDTADSDVMQTLSVLGVKMIAQRAAGFDRIDTKAARAYGMTVARVPAYSPYAVAEMAVALLMSVNRKISRANNRVRMANFTLDAGLMGMDIFGKTVGVMGTGKIGQILCNIIKGFGAELICYDVHENDDVKAIGGTYVSKEEIFRRSDVLFLMMPLLPATAHTINDSVLSQLKKGVILINTSRGGLIDTKALLKGIEKGIIAGVGMDVYENEQEYFFQDWSARQIQDPDLRALLGDNKVTLTAHQAFFTKEAVDKIVGTTIENLQDFSKGLTGRKHPNNCIPAMSEDDS